LKALLKTHDFILAEAAIVERLRRDASIQLDDHLVHTHLVDSEEGRDALSKVYREYLDIAAANHSPILLCTPTWRANRDRVEASSNRQDINEAAARFMTGLVADHAGHSYARIGGLIGCKNDCYLPEEGLSLDEAREFHQWQIDALAGAGIDFLIAVTLPCVEEAAGIALAMETTGLPYIISFVIDSDGRILDGTDLKTAIDYIDTKTTHAPLGYFVNCSYPSFLCAALLNETGQSDACSRPLSGRLIGIQANASALSHSELEGSTELKSESVSDWGRLMVQLNRDFGVKILGGCCGTDGRHLEYLARNISGDVR